MDLCTIGHASAAFTPLIATLAHAATLAIDSPSCLLCYEADPCICRRLRIGEWLARHHGFTVRHLAVPMAVSGPSL